MTYYLVKIAITTVLIVAISEIAKRSTFVGAILWLYVDTKDVTKVSALPNSVFWLVLPSLALFVTLPLLLKNGFNFYLSMGISIVITAVCFFLMVTVLSHFGVKL